MTKALLIDPYVEEVREVEFDGTFDALAPLIDCNYITPIQYEGQTLFVDEEALQTRPGDPRFTILGWPEELIGKAVMVRMEINEDDDEEEEYLDVSMSVEYLRCLVEFL